MSMSTSMDETKTQEEYRFKCITIVINSLGGGGAERCCATLANYWSDKGNKVTIITVRSKNRDVYSLRPGVNRIALDVNGSSDNKITGIVRNIKILVRLAKLMQRLRPNVLIGIMSTASIFVGLMPVSKRCLKVGYEQIHPPSAPLRRPWNVARKWCYGHLDVVVTLTETTADWIAKNTRAKRTSVIANPVCFPLESGKPEKSIQKLVNNDDRIVVAAGRLERQKGFDLLIQAFASLASQHTKWKLIIVGEGTQRSSLEEQIGHLGLSTRIFLPGWVGNIGEWFQASDIYVMSSRFEGFGNTLAEAMSYGLPAVSFDCEAGPRQIIRHMRDGLLVPPEDCVKLGVALATLMNDESIRVKMSEAAKETRKRFGIKEIGKQWTILFDQGQSNMWS